MNLAWRRDVVTYMKHPASFVAGIVLTLAGIVFALQGLGVMSGSAMSNTLTWSILGPIIAVIGAGLIYRGARSARATHPTRDDR